MNSRPKFLLPASLAAALACAACGGGAREFQTAETAALVSAPAQLLAPEAPAPAAARRAFTPVVAPGAGLALAGESVAEKSEKLKYEIGIEFPQLRGASPHAAKFNRAVRALVAREVRDFKPTRVDAKEDRFWSEREHWEGVHDSLHGRYEVVHFADDLIGVRFSLDVYHRGAAHAVQFYRVLNFDLKTGRPLALDNLFAPGSRHLHALADHCKAELRRRDAEAHRGAVAEAARDGRPASAAGRLAPDSWFLDGAGPEAENYGAWNLTAEGVLVSFAACQVDACAGGEKEVLVPYSALDAVLNQSSPAARLFTRQPR